MQPTNHSQNVEITSVDRVLICVVVSEIMVHYMDIYMKLTATILFLSHSNISSRRYLIQYE